MPTPACTGEDIFSSGGKWSGRVSISFLTVTTYGMAVRIDALADIFWECVVLDEAQAIKNPTTKQTRAVKKLKAGMRIAMTGTPIENDLTNLWSLFDFLDKGLLGSFSEFRDFCKGLEDRPEGYARLRAMISPFMLRRVKTDKEIISDLPDKLEESGKFELLRELCETIYEKRERVLIFTQFKEIIPHLNRFLAGVFHGKGFALHGETPVKERNRMVESFQGEEYVPYMILSVKAGERD